MNNQQKQKVPFSRVEWLLVAIHIGSLLFAFYCIFNSYSIMDNGDEADTRWAAEGLRQVMYVLVGFTLSTGSFLLIIRYFLQPSGKRQG